MSFKGITDISQAGHTETIDINVKYWLDWSFLEIGAYVNIETPVSGVLNERLDRLIPVSDPYYTDGQVWKAFRDNFVWESGVSYSPSPIRPSGVFINDVFTSGNFDYANGRVILYSGVSVTSRVTAEYSYKWINVLSDSDGNYLDEVIGDSFKVEEPYTSLSSGVYNQSNLQLPAVIYEIIGRTNQGYQLGLGQWARSDVLFHVLAEDDWSCKKIADILTDQNEKTIFMFDVDLFYTSGVNALNQLGYLNDGALTYPDLIQPKEYGGYRSNKLRLYDANQQSKTRLANGLYHIPIRFKTEVIRADI